MSRFGQLPVEGRGLAQILELHGLAAEDFANRIVYDLGCGTTDLEAELAARGVKATVIGFDQDPRVLDGSTARNIIPASLDDLPVKRLADIVVATFSLPYWGEDPDQILAFYRECERVVGQGGILSVYPVGIYLEELGAHDRRYQDRLDAARLGAYAIRSSRAWRNLGRDPSVLTVQKL